MGPVVPDWAPRVGISSAEAEQTWGSRVASESPGLMATVAFLGLSLPSESAGQPGSTGDFPPAFNLPSTTFGYKPPTVGADGMS